MVSGMFCFVAKAQQSGFWDLLLCCYGFLGVFWALLVGCYSFATWFWERSHYGVLHVEST